MNRWLGRAPRSADEVKRLQFCCDSPEQCSYCPFRPENASASIRDLARRQLSDAFD